MTQVIVDENCRGISEKELLRMFSLALANQDIDTAMTMLADDIHLNVPGYGEAYGQTDVRTLLTDDMDRSDAMALHIKNIFGENNRYAVDGEWSFEDGGKAAFCTLYTLSRQAGMAISEITTYAVILTERVML